MRRVGAAVEERLAGTRDLALRGNFETPVYTTRYGITATLRSTETIHRANMAAVQTARRWILTGSVTAITVMGALYGAELKGNQERAQVHDTFSVFRYISHVSVREHEHLLPPFNTKSLLMMFYRKGTVSWPFHPTKRSRRMRVFSKSGSTPKGNWSVNWRTSMLGRKASRWEKAIAEPRSEW